MPPSAHRVTAPSVDVFAALGDPVRRQILELVAVEGPITATTLTATVPLSRQGIAKHLDVLRGAGLVTSERQGRETRYIASLGAFDEVARWMDDVGRQWDQRLDRLAARVTTGRPSTAPRESP